MKTLRHNAKTSCVMHVSSESISRKRMRASICQGRFLIRTGGIAFDTLISGICTSTIQESHLLQYISILPLDSHHATTPPLPPLPPPNQSPLLPQTTLPLPLLHAPPIPNPTPRSPNHPLRLQLHPLRLKGIPRRRRLLLRRLLLRHHERPNVPRHPPALERPFRSLAESRF